MPTLSSPMIQMGLLADRPLNPGNCCLLYYITDPSQQRWSHWGGNGWVDLCPGLGSDGKIPASQINTIGGGGSGGQLIVPFVSDGSAVQWINMPVTMQFFNQSHRYVTKADLTNFSQVRLVVNKQSTAGATNTVIGLRYRTAFNNNISNWLPIAETGNVQVAINVQDSVLDSGWISLASNPVFRYQ